MSNRSITSFPSGGDALQTVKETQLFTLKAAGIIPDSNPYVMYRSVVSFIKVMDDYGVTSHPAIRVLIKDARLPGWARLLLALYSGSMDDVKQLGKHSVSLSTRIEEEGGALNFSLDEKAFLSLSPARRLRLSASGVSISADLTIADLPELTAELSKSFWGDKRNFSTTAFNWTASDYKSSLETLKQFQADLLPSAYLDLLLNLVVAHDAFLTHSSDTVQAFIEALNGADDKDWPRIDSRLNADWEVIESAADGTHAGQSLAALLLTSKAVKNRRSKAANNRASQSVIPEGLLFKLIHKDSFLAIMNFLDGLSIEVLVRVLVKIADLDPSEVGAVRNTILRQLGQQEEFLHSEELRELWPELGSGRDSIVWFIQVKLNDFSPTKGSEAKGAFIAALPDWLKEELATSADENGSVYEMAQIEMVKAGYTPQREILVTKNQVVNAIEKAALQQASSSGAVSLPVIAWLKRVSAQDFVKINERVLDRLDRTPREIAIVINEARKFLSHSEDASSLFELALKRSKDLPSNQTLSMFAKSLTETLKRM